MVILTGWQKSFSPSHTWTSQWSQTVDTFSNRWKRNELNLNMERLSLAFSKMVTVLSDEQLGSKNTSWTAYSIYTFTLYIRTTENRLDWIQTYLLTIKLHLFRSVEYGVGVAQQFVITTLNLWKKMQIVAPYSIFIRMYNKKEWLCVADSEVRTHLLLSPLASIPIKTSEPISDVSITYGASFAYRNFEFYKPYRGI